MADATNVIHSLTTFDAQVVSNSHKPDTGDFVYEQFPVINCPDPAQGYLGATADVEHPSARMDDGSDYDIGYGEKVPSAADTQTKPVTFESRRLVVGKRPLHAAPGLTNLEYRRQILSTLGPDQMDRNRAKLERRFLSHLATAYSTASITAAAVKADALLPTENIWKNIFSALRTANFYNYRSMDMPLEAVISDTALLILSRYEELTGVLESGITGANVRLNSGMPIEAMAQVLGAKLGIDKVHVAKSRVNIAAQGSSPTPDFASSFESMMWVGFVDRRSSSYDVRAGFVPTMGPSLITGSLGLNPNLFIDSKDLQETKTEYYWSEIQAKVQNNGLVTAFTDGAGTAVPVGLTFTDIF